MTINNMVLDYVDQYGILSDSFWPFKEAELKENGIQTDVPAGDGGPWTLHMALRGDIFLWPTDKRVPFLIGRDAQPIARGDKEELEKFFTWTSSSAGYWDDHPYKYQPDARRFNWPTGTQSGVAIAIQCAQALLDGDVMKGWDIGKGFEPRVNSIIHA
jgi:hypothetical protein